MSQLRGRTFEVDFKAEPYEIGAVLISVLIVNGSDFSASLEAVRVGMVADLQNARTNG
jgi:hypothetical protein